MWYGSLEQLAELQEKEEEEEESGSPFMAQRPVCASISRSSICHRRCEMEVCGRGGGVWW